MDEATENLILQLQLEDIEEERDRSKGKARKDDEIADADLALQVQEEEFKHTITIRSDYRMAQSIGRAVTDDAVNIAVLAGEERRAAADREMACRLSGQTARPDPQTSILDTDDDVLSRLSALNIDVATGEESQESSSSPGEAGESSAWATGRRPQRLNGPKNKCDTCMDMKHTVQMPCAHHYCRHCTVRLFTEALPDESLFPVRCCRQNIPMSLVSSYLGTDLTRQVEKKAVEYATTNRTYCHVASCATFIEPGYTHGSTGICPREHCGSQTCILCKKPAHDGDCPPRDDGSEEALQLAQSNGWQRCEQCQNVVELNHGCNHITCRCRYEFCYLCGARWRTCACTLFDEDRLLERAEQIADRPQPWGVPAADAADRIGRIHDIARELNDRHDCEHGEGWRKIAGRFHCEDCGHWLREFILECPDCMLRACVRCVRNRL